MGSAQIAFRFFSRRRPLGITRQHTGGGKAQVEYANVSKIIGVIVGRRLATLLELQTVYGIEDAHNLLEVIAIDAANERE
jgi:hypothetical protein